MSAEGLVIRGLELQGFMRYLERQSIPFDEKFTVITGRTGSGKTSLLDAITFALYGNTSRTDVRSIKVSDVVRKGGYARLRFGQRGDEYEVERGLNGRGVPFLSLRKNGSAVMGGIEELNKVIVDVVGLDYVGFTNSTFVRQEEMRQLGSDTPAERLSIFRKLFRLETFEKAQEAAKAKLEEGRLETGEREASLRTRTEELQRLPALKEEMERLKAENDRLGGALGAVEDDLRNKEEGLEKAEKAHDDYSKNLARMEALDAEVLALGRRIGVVREGLEDYERTRAAVEELEEGVKGVEELRKGFEALREKSHERSRLEGVLELRARGLRELKGEHERKLRTLRDRARAEEARIASLSTSVDGEQAFSVLREEGALGERLRRIEKELAWLSKRKAIVAQLRDEKAETSELLEEVRVKSSSINKDSFVLSEIRSNVEKLGADIESEEVTFSSVAGERQAEIDGLAKELDGLGFGDEEKRKLTIMGETLAALERDRAKLERTRQRLKSMGDVSSVIADLASRKAEKERELGGLRELDGRLKDSERAYAALKGDLKALRARRDELGEGLNRRRGQLEQASKRLTELEGLRAKMEEDRELLAATRARSAVYTILKDEVFHNRGIVMYAINQITPQLSIEASNDLGDLSAGRFTKVKLEALAEGARYGIAILVEGLDGRWHDVFEFSGGERTQINAALRFSIARELASLPQVGRTYGRMRTLFIDEGDLGSLDTESSRGLFVKKLLDMGEHFDRIILITHLSDVAEAFPGRIRVEMDQENASRVHIEDGGGGHGPG